MKMKCVSLLLLAWVARSPHRRVDVVLLATSAPISSPAPRPSLHCQLHQGTDSEDGDNIDDNNNVHATLCDVAKEQANMLAKKARYASDVDCQAHIDMQIEAVEKLRDNIIASQPSNPLGAQTHIPSPLTMVLSPHEIPCEGNVGPTCGAADQHAYMSICNLDVLVTALQWL